MFERIYQILEAFLGESKNGGYDKQRENYQFNCPCCAEENDGEPDGKHNLEVLLSPTKGLLYHCWKCEETHGTRGSLTFLVKRYGGKWYRDYKNELKALKESQLYNFELFEDVLKEEEDFVRLPKTFRKIDLNNCKDKRVVAYLNSRKVDQNIIDKFNIGYTTWDEKKWNERNRIIVPSYDKYGDLNYWVGRSFLPKKEPKEGELTPKFQPQNYKNCDADKTKIIFQEELIDWDSPILLVEGVFDSLFFPNTIALLGKLLNKDTYTYQSIMKNAKAGVIIALDGDTKIEETKRIYSRLNRGKLFNKVYFIDMSKEKYKDIAETYEKEGKMGLINLMKHKQQFSEIDLIF